MGGIFFTTVQLLTTVVFVYCILYYMSFILDIYLEKKIVVKMFSKLT